MHRNHGQKSRGQKSRGGLAVAPMMAWTDRHCRYFHRLLAPRAVLYSEMVTADAVLHGDRARLLEGHHTDSGGVNDGGGVVLQLGGSCPQKLALAISHAKEYGYSEYNLNIGCPSGRVQSGRFGACLMAEPLCVRDCVSAMIDAAYPVPVTVKCRLGIDAMDIESGLDDFIDVVSSGGVEHFIIHARKAWLKGLSPKENRSVPMLDYARVRRLRDSFPQLAFSINGGITSSAEAVLMASEFYGVMVGRAAYQRPYILAEMAAQIYGHAIAGRMEVALAMADYAEGACARGVKLVAITRHMLGLMSGLSGARAWRRALSEGVRHAGAGAEVIRTATLELMEHIDSHRGRKTEAA